MNKRLIIIKLLLFAFYGAFSQGIGMGTSQPDSSAALDITATGKGLLPPRMSIHSILSISRPAKGLLAYDSSSDRLMVNVGSPAVPNWQPVASNRGGTNDSAWNIKGNGRINPARQFIGSTDGQSLRFRVNNRPTGELNPANGNVFWGLQAGQTGTVGSHTIAIGPQALQSDSTTGELVAVGDSALFNNSKADGNTALGSKALFSNTDGFSNTATGSNSLFSNAGGSSNTATGSSSLFSNLNGVQNVAAGEGSLFSNSSGSFNVAIGRQSLSFNISGSSNTAVGHEALFSNTTGNSNTGTGRRSLFSNSTGSSNVAMGDSSLLSNSKGSNNTAIGFHSMINTTAGSLNTAIGFLTLSNNITGGNNVAVGPGALIDLNDELAIENVGIGNSALHSSTKTGANVAVGVGALNQALGQFLENTAVGAEAAGFGNVGDDNTAIGSGARLIENAARDVSLGAGSANTFLTDEVVLGNTDITSIGGAVNFSNLSDGRFKKNIQDNVRGVDFIMKLRPITYQVDFAALDSRFRKAGDIHRQASIDHGAAGQMVHSGFIAQEVERAAGELGYNFNGISKPRQEGGLYALRYETFVMPLVKALQEQQQVIVELRRVNGGLEDRLESLKKNNTDRRALNDDLQRRLERLESSLEKK